MQRGAANWAWPKALVLVASVTVAISACSGTHDDKTNALQKGATTSSSAPATLEPGARQASALDPDEEPCLQSVTGNAIGPSPRIELANHVELVQESGTESTTTTSTTTTIKSVNPVPVPTPPSAPGIAKRGKASGGGDVHLRTFDNLAYDLQAVGEFVLLRSDDDDLEVQSRMAPWESSRTVSITTAVATKVMGDRVGVYLGAETPLIINGVPTMLSGEGVHLPHGGLVLANGTVITVTAPDGSHVDVELRSTQLAVTLSMCRARSAHLSGLLGDFDDRRENDMATRSGTILHPERLGKKEYFRSLYKDFGASWRISDDESLFDYGPGQSTRTFTDLTFPDDVDPLAGVAPAALRRARAQCKDAGLDGTLLENCVYDVAVTGEKSFADDTVAMQTAVNPSKEERQFACIKLDDGTGRCTDNTDVPNGTRDHSTYVVHFETLAGDTPRTETFTCGPISQSRGRCIFTTTGILFQDASVTVDYTSDDGTTNTVALSLDCYENRQKGERC